jgi:AraC family transcriptional regulator, positive regulator of tynA and feaB
METLFSTEPVHPCDRFDFWHSVACRNIVRHDSVPESRQTFRAKLRSGVLSDIKLVVFENSPMAVAHTTRHIAHLVSDELFICRQIAGSCLIEQDSREAPLEPGDITLLDPRLPYTAKFSGDSKMLVLKVAAGALRARLGSTRRLTACCVKPASAEASLTSTFLAALPAHVGQLSTGGRRGYHQDAGSRPHYTMFRERHRRAGNTHCNRAVADGTQSASSD